MRRRLHRTGQSGKGNSIWPPPPRTECRLRQRRRGPLVPGWVTVAPLNLPQSVDLGRAESPQIWRRAACTEFQLRYDARNMARVARAPGATSPAAFSTVVPTDAPDSNQATATFSSPRLERTIFYSRSHVRWVPHHRARAATRQRTVHMTDFLPDASDPSSACKRKWSTTARCGRSWLELEASRRDQAVPSIVPRQRLAPQRHAYSWSDPVLLFGGTSSA